MRQFSLGCVLFLSCSAWAGDPATVAALLYPKLQQEQEFTAKFFSIVEAHRTRDPLFEGAGPSITGFSLDRTKFAFLLNRTATTVDLAIFNWPHAAVQGFLRHDALSASYGSEVWIYPSVPIPSIATQGENNDLLPNFSYLDGSTHVVDQLLNDVPESVIPEFLRNWRPHPAYMDATHPLRMALGSGVLSLFSPSEDLFYDSIGLNGPSRLQMEAKLAEEGGFENVIMGMMVHEAFHVREGEDNALHLTRDRDIPEDRAEVGVALRDDSNLKGLVGTYVRIVFKLGSTISNGASPSALLADLAATIARIKQRSPMTWNYIWAYEYTEGFAEYVSAFSMIQVGITTLETQVGLQKRDRANNFAYRTGAIAGLFLAQAEVPLPFEGGADRRMSLWELAIAKSNVQPSTEASEQIEKRYADEAFDTDHEIAAVIEYLESTIEEIEVP
jgi:hypothetical protein